MTQTAINSLMEDPEASDTIGRLKEAGQTDLLSYLTTCGNAERKTILEDFKPLKVDLLSLKRKFEDSLRQYEEAKEVGPLSDLLPPAALLVNDVREDAELAALVRASPRAADLLKSQEMSDELKRNTALRGTAALAAQEVALVVLAGGQGTRLGYDGPKGCFRPGLQSGLSIFGVLMNRAKSRLRSLGCQAPVYIMVSAQNRKQTETHFQENDFFGLPEADIVFFQQTAIPSFSREGQMLLESRSKLSSNANGNGGLFVSLADEGMLEDMQLRSVKYLHVVGVDNLLCNVLDPLFIGACIAAKVDVGNKCVEKTNAEEKCGVAAIRQDSAGRERPCVIEYTEIREALSRAKKEDGSLLFSSANICHHFFTLDFIWRLNDQNMLSYHVAEKKVLSFDPQRNDLVLRDAIKLEYFIFDSFMVADKVLVFETSRALEFSPIKNKEGKDSAATAVLDLVNYHTRLLALSEAGTRNETFDGRNPQNVLYEIHPDKEFDGQWLLSAAARHVMDGLYTFRANGS